MLSFAPRLDPRLRREISRIDDGTRSFAEVARRVGAKANALGLPRPSYERVRVLAHEFRRRAGERLRPQVAVRFAAELPFPRPVARRAGVFGFARATVAASCAAGFG